MSKLRYFFQTKFEKNIVKVHERILKQSKFEENTQEVQQYCEFMQYVKDLSKGLKQSFNLNTTNFSKTLEDLQQKYFDYYKKHCENRLKLLIEIEENWVHVKVVPRVQEITD